MVINKLILITNLELLYIFQLTLGASYSIIYSLQRNYEPNKINVHQSLSFAWHQ